MKNDCFKALSDPVRRGILQLLRDGKMAAGDIAERFDLTGATISYHLSILKNADLIYEKRERKYIFYGLNTSVLEDIIVWITSLSEEQKADKKNVVGRKIV